MQAVTNVNASTLKDSSVSIAKPGRKFIPMSSLPICGWIALSSRISQSSTPSGTLMVTYT